MGKSIRTKDRDGGGGEPTGVSLELLDRLRPYLAESLMVLDEDWTVKANLAPPGGLIGRGLGLGVHTLEDMHPDDAVQVMELGLQAFTTTPGWQGSKVVRMRTGDGAYGRYEITAINRFDDPVINGMVVRTRELPPEAIEEWKGFRPTSAVETLADVLPIGVLLLSHQGQIVFANETACGMLDQEPESLKRNGFTPSVAEDDRGLVTDVLRRVTESPGHEECTVQLACGAVERVACCFSSEGQDDDVARVVVTLEDVTQRHAAERELEQRANHDQLTGLRNRASLFDLLGSRLGEQRPTAVAYIDLDGFKAVNDTWGHEGGDSFLVAVAAALQAGVADGAEVARLGGDEFVVVTDSGDGLETQVTQAVASAAAAQGVSVTCSVGVGGSVAGDSPDDLLRRADDAMYAAKGVRR